MAHPVGMTFFQLGEFGGGDNRTLFESEADWISPGGYTKYARNPRRPTDVTCRCWIPIISTGSAAIRTTSGRVYAGYNPIYMDPFDGP